MPKNRSSTVLAAPRGTKTGMRIPPISRRNAIVLIASVAVAVLILVAVLHGLSGRPGTGTSATSGPHATYQFVLEPLSPSTVWHPGQHVVLRWLATPIGTSQAHPIALRCTVQLYGPYPTKERAADQESVVSPPPSSGGQSAQAVSPAVQAPSLSLTNATSRAQTITLTLPTSLAPGYYILRSLQTSAAPGGAAVGSVSIVHVASS